VFRVRWKRSALDELAAQWTNADSAIRAAITAASAELDHRLKNDAQNVGESRAGALRVCFEFPLGIMFEVDSEQSLVKVLRV
jgi:hypothetical protein